MCYYPWLWLFSLFFTFQRKESMLLMCQTSFAPVKLMVPPNVGSHRADWAWVCALRQTPGPPWWNPLNIWSGLSREQQIISIMSNVVFLKLFWHVHSLCLSLRLLSCTSGKPGSALLSFHVWEDFQCGVVSLLREARWKYGFLRKVRNSS